VIGAAAHLSGRRCAATWYTVMTISVSLGMPKRGWVRALYSYDVSARAISTNAGKISVCSVSVPASLIIARSHERINWFVASYRAEFPILSILRAYKCRT